MEEIRIEYDGAYPCLCMGHLKVWIGDKLWDFGEYCLSSGGCIKRDDDWDMWAEQGKWDIVQWPNGFPEELQSEVLDAVNLEIPWGCCGGCI